MMGLFSHGKVKEKGGPLQKKLELNSNLRWFTNAEFALSKEKAVLAGDVPVISHYQRCCFFAIKPFVLYERCCMMKKRFWGQFSEFCRLLTDRGASIAHGLHTSPSEFLGKPEGFSD